MESIKPTKYDSICPDCQGKHNLMHRCTRCKQTGLVPNQAGLELLNFIRRHRLEVVASEVDIAEEEMLALK